ncbi:hypothetical protein ACHAWF_013629 [Thalassiosira exigua]
MVRTKKHFRPPSPSSSSSSSEEEEEAAPPQVVQRGRGKQLMGGNFGRGKQLSMAAPPPPPPSPPAVTRPPARRHPAMPPGGRGKMLRPPEPDDREEESSDDDSSSDDSSSSEEEEALPPPPAGRGKQLRPAGRGKQLRAPSPPPSPPRPPPAAQPPKEDESESSSSEEEEEERPATRPPPAATTTAASVPAQRGGGKQFGGKMLAARGGGKQLHRQTTPTAKDDSSSSSSDEEPWAAPRGRGKQLRPPPAPAAKKEESDMEESSSEEEEEDKKKEPEPEPEPKPPKKAAPAKKQPAEKKQPEPEPEKEPEPAEEASEESEFEPEEAPKKASSPQRRGRPPRAAAARAAKSAAATARKEASSAEEEEKESDSESESSSDEEQEWDMETFDMQRLVRGEDDKRYLDSLTELERENILAERFEKLKSEADMNKALRENKRREREQKKEARKKKPEKKPAAKKRAAPSRAKRASPAKKKKAAVKESDSEEEEEAGGVGAEEEGAPDTGGDEALAQSLAGKRVSARNLVKKGKQFKKQAALAKIRQNRASKAAAAEESDSEFDYGRDSDDSDDDYEDELKPWQQRGKKAATTSRLDEESSEEDDSGREDGVRDDDRHREGADGQRRSADIEAELEDYINVSLPRRRLVRWCNEPFFEKAVKGFYVRLGIGRDNKTQKPCYRLCEITGIVTKSEYTFPSYENKKPYGVAVVAHLFDSFHALIDVAQVSTDKWLAVSFGKHVREFKMITVSDHRPSADDVTKLIGQLKTERQSESVLTKKAARKLRKRQDELVNNYTYTKEDVDRLVKEKKKRNKKALNIAVEKTRIAISVQAAKDEVEDAKKRLEDAKVERMEADEGMEASMADSSVTKANEALEIATKKLEEKIEEQKRIQKEDQDRINRLKQSSKVQNWVKVNQRAKMANRNADFQSYKEQQEKEKIQGSAEPKFDPYARRRVKPKNLWEVGGSKPGGEKASEALSSGAVEEEKKEATPTERDDFNAGKDNGDKENSKRDDIPDPQKLELPGQAANPFAFDDDIVMGGDVGIGTKKSRTRARNGISLEEYQERKTAGTL